MKFLTLILFTTFFAGRTIAQKTFTYSDSTFIYKVLVDSAIRSDGVNYDCFVKSISITRQADDKLLQTIIPPDNSFFCNLPKDQIFILEDINFDQLNDFRVIQFLPAGPNIPYYFWTFDIKSQQFHRDTAIEEITSPEFNHEQKVITSFWRASCCDHGLSTYKYINGKIILVEETEIADDLNKPGQQIMTRKKLVNGKMKLVERTVEKAEGQKE